MLIIMVVVWARSVDVWHVVDVHGARARRRRAVCLSVLLHVCCVRTYVHYKNFVGPDPFKLL